MLLYHFPLNTADNISNFTNVGLKNDYVVGSGFIQGDNGHISSVSADTNSSVNSFASISLLDYLRVSICMRVKIKGTMTNNQALIWSKMSPTNTDASRLYVQSNQNSTVFNFHLPNSTAFQVNLSGSWFDLIIVKDGNHYSFYVNGVKKSEVEDSNIIENLYLCDRSLGGWYRCNALIQDIRIYDYALSQAEINEYSRALVVHYPLQGNELNQSVLKDVSGFGNDIILKSDDCFNSITDFVRGNKIQQCRSKFLGTDMRLSGGTAYGQTISFWVRQNFATASMSGIWTYLFTHRIYDGENSDFSYLANGAGRQALWNNKNSISMPLTAGNLYHIAIVYNGTTRKVYANGSAYNTSNVTLNSFNINYILMGNGGNDPRYDKCISIVDYRIYATALSAEDIKNLYNSPISVSKQHQTMAFEFVEGNDGFSANKNGIVQHNELRENDSDVNGCYNNKLITNELIEN